MTKLVVNLFKYGEVYMPSIFDQFTFDNFKIVSYMDAAKALNINMLPQNMGFFEVEGSIILDKYIKQYEELFDLELIIKNSMCGNFIEHKTPTICVVSDNYIRQSEILFNNKFIDFYNYLRLKHGFVSLQKNAIENSKITVALTKQTAEDYKNEFGVECKIIENGVDIEKFKPLPNKESLREKYGIPKDKKVGIWFGNFVPNNWFFMPRLIKDFQDIFWVLVFKHPMAYKPKSTNVKILCGAGLEYIPELLNISNFLINPSFWNNFGMIDIEAMACNIPIITSRTGIFFDWESGDCGYIITQQEYKKFQEAVQNIIKGEQEFRSREVLIQEKLVLSRWIEDWKNLIKKVIE